MRYKFQKPKIRLPTGMLIVSIDIDVGNKELGKINRGKNDTNVNRSLSEYSVGAIEEWALPMFASLFEEFEVPVTFAIRGQWLKYPNPALSRLLRSSIKHDIGAHGYTHRRFGHLSQEEANIELMKISDAMKCHNIDPVSFVFPGNVIAHLNILPRYGYTCYREYGDVLKDGMYIRRHNCLWDVHPTLFIDKYTTFAPAKRILDICISRKLPFHAWFHLWNFGQTQSAIRKMLKCFFYPLLNYAKLRVGNGELAFETMASAVQVVNEKVELSL
jgi:peptidoglycan/xylan/chitin deacetylase (PgdA/CDA1 family)